MTGDGKVVTLRFRLEKVPRSPQHFLSLSLLSSSSWDFVHTRNSLVLSLLVRGIFAFKKVSGWLNGWFVTGDFEKRLCWI